MSHPAFTLTDAPGDGGASGRPGAETALASSVRPSSNPGGAPALPGRSALLAAIGIGAFLLLWSGASLWKSNPIQLPGPLSVAAALADLAQEGELWPNAWISIQRVFIGLVLSVLLAVPLGIAMGLHRGVEAFVDPLIEILRPVAGIAWIPLALFVFGVGNVLPIFILVYVGSFQLLLATVAGVKAVDSRLLAAARTMGVRRQAIIRKVVIPAALPQILSGLRLAFAATWSAIVAAELIGAPSGVGFAIEWYRQLLATPKVFAFIAVIGAIGYASDLLLRWLQARIAPLDRQSSRTGGAGRVPARASTAAARLRAFGVGVALPLTLIAAWQAWASALPASSPAPSPARVVTTFGTLVASGQLPMAMLQSLGRVIAGFTIAVLLAVPIGFAMGRSRVVQGVLAPVVEGFRPIAPMAVLPVAILWLGTGTPTAFAVVAYAAFFPLLVNTAVAAASVDPQLLRAARTMGISPRATARRVILAGALPGILLGGRLGMGVAWTAIIAAELAVGSASGGGSSGGIGQMMFLFYSYSVDLNGIVVCMIAVGIIALLIDRVFRLAERRLTPWRFTHER